MFDNLIRHDPRDKGKTIVPDLAHSWEIAKDGKSYMFFQRKKTLEDNNYNLRKVPNIPGTGPFKTVRRVEDEVWVVEKNKDYWNKGLP